MKYRCNPTNRENVSSRENKVARVLQMRAEGSTYTAISSELGIPRNTVKSWGRRYGDCNVYEDTDFDAPDLERKLEATEEPDFGDVALCCLQEMSIQRIFLVGGPLYFRGKIDAFASRVPQMLQYNLNIGDVFVFCSQRRRQLSILQWQGQEFALMFRRTENTRYP